jgi:hypothetical protein
MNFRKQLARVLIWVGLAAMVLGAVDPLEGSYLLILPGSVLAALAAFLAQAEHRHWIYAGFLLVGVGVGALFFLSNLGGVGGQTERSYGWMILVIPYPIGWLLDLIAIIKTRKEYRLTPQTA